MSQSARQYFPAFATTIQNDGPRVPISAERIVLVLGEDGHGNTAEISISLEKSGANPGKVQIAALGELRLDERSTLERDLIVEEVRTPRGLCVNVRLLSVNCRLVPMPRPIHEQWPPTTL